MASAAEVRRELEKDDKVKRRRSVMLRIAAMQNVSILAALLLLYVVVP